MVLLHQSYRSGNDPFTSSLLLRFSFTTHPSSSSLSLEKVMPPHKELPSSTQRPLARFSPGPSIFGEVLNPSQQDLLNVAAEGGTGTGARLAISTTSTNGSTITHKGPDATERSRVNHGSQHENLAVPESKSSATPDDQVSEWVVDHQLPIFVLWSWWPFLPNASKMKSLLKSSHELHIAK